jgi:hypothetical protein
MRRHPSGQDSGIDLHEPVDPPQLGQHADEEEEEQVYD